MALACSSVSSLAFKLSKPEVVRFFHAESAVSIIPLAAVEDFALPLAVEFVARDQPFTVVAIKFFPSLLSNVSKLALVTI